MAQSTAPITRRRPRGLPPVLPSHDPAEDNTSPASLASPVSPAALPNNTTGGKPRAYTAHAGIRIHCAYDEIADVDSLVGHPRNPNVHPAAQIELLAKIITGSGAMEEEDDTNHLDGGYREAITLSRRSGFIIKGHGRRGAAMLIKQQTGETAVPIVWQDYANEAEEYADMVADNRIAELSALDPKQVSELVSEITIAFPDYDIGMFGFQAFEVNAFVTPGQSNDPNAEWEGMPEFSQEDKLAWKNLIVNFRNIDDLQAFAVLIGQALTDKTRSVWHPANEVAHVARLRYRQTTTTAAQ